MAQVSDLGCQLCFVTFVPFNSFGLKEEWVMKIKVIKKSGAKLSFNDCPWVIDVPLEKR